MGLSATPGSAPDKGTFFGQSITGRGACLADSPFSPSILILISHPRPHLLFHQKRTHLGGGGAHCAISVMSEKEVRDKDQRIAWDVPNLMVCELTICSIYTYNDVHTIIVGIHMSSR